MKKINTNELFTSPLVGEVGAKRRMRGAFLKFWYLYNMGKAPLTRRFASTSPTGGEVTKHRFGSFFGLNNCFYEKPMREAKASRSLLPLWEKSARSDG